MAKVKCKGTTLKHTVSASLATIAQVISLEVSVSIVVELVPTPNV